MSKTPVIVYEGKLRDDGGWYAEQKGQPPRDFDTWDDLMAYLFATGLDFTLYRYMDDKDDLFCPACDRFNCEKHPATVADEGKDQP